MMIIRVIWLGATAFLIYSGLIVFARDEAGVGSYLAFARPAAIWLEDFVPANREFYIVFAYGSTREAAELVRHLLFAGWVWTVVMACAVIGTVFWFDRQAWAGMDRRPSDIALMLLSSLVAFLGTFAIAYLGVRSSLRDIDIVSMGGVWAVTFMFLVLVISFSFLMVSLRMIFMRSH